MTGCAFKEYYINIKTYQSDVGMHVDFTVLAVDLCHLLRAQPHRIHLRLLIHSRIKMIILVGLTSDITGVLNPT